jgi:hypothetical protein
MTDLGHLSTRRFQDQGLKSMNHQRATMPNSPLRG